MRSVIEPLLRHIVLHQLALLLGAAVGCLFEELNGSLTDIFQAWQTIAASNFIASYIGRNIKYHFVGVQ